MNILWIILLILICMICLIWFLNNLKKRTLETFLALGSFILAVITFIILYPKNETELSVNTLDKKSITPYLDKMISVNGIIKYVSWENDYRFINNSDDIIFINKIKLTSNNSNSHQIASIGQPFIFDAYNTNVLLNMPIELSPKSTGTYLIKFLFELHTNDSIINFYESNYNFFNPDIYASMKDDPMNDQSTLSYILEIESLIKDKIKVFKIDLQDFIDYNKKEYMGDKMFIPLEPMTPLFERSKIFPDLQFLFLPTRVEGLTFSNYTLSDLKIYCAANPKDIQAGLALSSMQWQNGDASSALQTLQKYKGSSKQEKAVIFSNIGFLLMNLNKFQEGLEYFKESIKLDSCNYIIASNLIEYYIFNRSWDEAKNICCDFIHSCNLADYKYFCDIIYQSFRTIGITDEDINCINYAIEKQPLDGTLYFYKGMYYSTKKEYRLAANAYRQALKYEQTNIYKYNSLNNLGRSLIEMDSLYEAQTIFENIATTNPKHFLAHYNLGEIYFKTNRLIESEREYIAALSLNPKAGFIYLKLSEIYSLLGDEQKANEYKEKANINHF